MCFLDNVGLDEKILRDEIRWICCIGQNTAHFRSREKDILRLLLEKKLLHRPPFCQVKFLMRAQQEIRMPGSTKASDKRRSDQSLMTGHVDFCCGVHGYS